MILLGIRLPYVPVCIWQAIPEAKGELAREKAELERQKAERNSAYPETIRRVTARRPGRLPHQAVGQAWLLLLVTPPGR